MAFVLVICTFYQLRSLQHAASGYTKRVQMRTKQLAVYSCHPARLSFIVWNIEALHRARAGGGAGGARPPQHFLKNKEIKLSTLEPRYNEGPRDWQNILVITRFVNLYQGVFFFILPYTLLLLELIKVVR